MHDLTRENPPPWTALLRAELTASNFSEAALRPALRAPFPLVLAVPHPRRIDAELLATFPARLAQLTRLLVLGETLALDAVRSIFSAELLAHLFEWGFLRAKAGRVSAQFLVIPWGEVQVACDRFDRRDAYEHVFIPNLGTRFMQLLVRSTAAPVLDVGTGPGTLALVAAKTSPAVVGIDISARAIGLARFNRALNALELEVEVADLVGYRAPRSDYGLIFCNLPAHSGEKEHLASVFSAPEVADVFVRELLRLASASSSEDGVCVLSHDLALGADPTDYFESMGAEKLSGLRIEPEFMPSFQHDGFSRGLSILARSKETRVTSVPLADRAIFEGPDPFASVRTLLAEAARHSGAEVVARYLSR